MDRETRRLILELMERHNLCTLATMREDGWPQATTVTYANDGLTLYVATGVDAQKVHNIRRWEKVSLTIDHDTPDWNAIQGLSMAASAQVLRSPSDILHAARLLKKKFPPLAELGKPEIDPGWAFLKLVPKVISVIDYTRGFGHTLLVRL